MPSYNTHKLMRDLPAQPNPEARLSCRNLVRFLGQDEARTQVLQSVNLELYSREVYAIVGPSGCGKSTLLYLLGLLDHPDDGQIWIGGRDVTSARDAQATRLRNELLGFVFQFHFLIKEFSALENVMLPMMKGGKFSDSEMRDRAQVLLEQVGLGVKTNRRANQLSGGEQQRVAIARALANKPQVVLADEPTGNLDTANSERAFELMRHIVHEEDITLLLVTHNPDIAEKSDHVLEMKDGRFIGAHDHPENYDT